MKGGAEPCGGKFPYPSRRKAQEALRKLKRRADKNGKDRPAVCVYRCDCGHYHLGGRTKHPKGTT